MKLKNLLISALLCSHLSGCGLFGEYSPHYEIIQPTRDHEGLCFFIKNPDDYYVHYLAIRNRNMPQMSGFNRELPALTLSSGQLCIPETYYHFHEFGEINVEMALRSPTKKMKRRFIMSEFTLINGVPFPFHPRDYSVPIPDAEDYQ